jgi:hypothetical protein
MEDKEDSLAVLLPAFKQGLGMAESSWIVHNCFYNWAIGTSHAWFVFLFPVPGVVPGSAGCVRVGWKALGV